MIAMMITMILLYYTYSISVNRAQFILNVRQLDDTRLTIKHFDQALHISSFLIRSHMYFTITILSEYFSLLLLMLGVFGSLCFIIYEHKQTVAVREKRTYWITSNNEIWYKEMARCYLDKRVDVSKGGLTSCDKTKPVSCTI